MANNRANSLVNNQKGFTLLEVMIAMAIMLVAFSSILMVQSNGLQSSTRAREINTVAMLMKQQLVETEFAIENKTFDEVKKEESGQFKEPFQDYTWKREVKEIKFPNLTSLAGAGAGADASASGGSSSSSSDSNQSGNAMADQMSRLVTNYLSKAIREVSVSVSWKRNASSQKISISMYWVDLNSAFQITE